MNREMQNFNQDWKATPSDQIKRYIVQLSKECIDHYSRSIDNKKDKFAFYVKVKSLNILLENYMDDNIKKITFTYMEEIKNEIDKIKKDGKEGKLTEETVKNHINNKRFEYMIPIFEQSLRIIQNSPITEVEAHGVIDLNSKDIKKRIRGEEKAIPIRGKHTDFEFMENEDKVEEGESAFSFSY